MTTSFENNLDSSFTKKVDSYDRGKVIIADAWHNMLFYSFRTLVSSCRVLYYIIPQDSSNMAQQVFHGHTTPGLLLNNGGSIFLREK